MYYMYNGKQFFNVSNFWSLKKRVSEGMFSGDLKHFLTLNRNGILLFQIEQLRLGEPLLQNLNFFLMFLPQLLQCLLLLPFKLFLNRNLGYILYIPLNSTKRRKRSQNFSNWIFCPTKNEIAPIFFQSELSVGVGETPYFQYKQQIIFGK